jgi:nucleotide-binding universal stress UspA family protein
VKRVLCAVDLSDVSVELLRHAQAIVHWYRGCLTVLHVVPTSDAPERRRGERVRPLVADLRDALAAAEITGNRVRYEVESGEPATVIVARSLATHADTIVLGTGARHGLERPLIGSVADAVVRRARCDVLTVPPRATYAPANGRASTIVCGVDFSTQSIDAVRATLDLADRMRARVVLVHAIEWLAEVEPPDLIDFDVSDLCTRLVCNAQRRLDAVIADESPLDRAVRTKVAMGRSHREVLGVATGEQADLIVVGHRGHGAAPIPLLGSTVEQVLRAAPCPVLTIQSPHQSLAHARRPVIPLTDRRTHA